MQQNSKSAERQRSQWRSQKTIDNNVKSKIMYTILGKQEDVDEAGNPLVFESGNDYAMEVTDNTDFVRYYIKKNSSGRLFNPISMYQEFKRDTQRYGRPEFSYAKVSQQAFEQYLTFLRTKNKLYLGFAERAVI